MNILRGLKTLAVFAAIGLMPTDVAYGNEVSLAAVVARLDQIQNITLVGHETRSYHINPATVAAVSRFGPTFGDPDRVESFSTEFSFFNQSAYYERTTDNDTLRYWGSKGLPAISRKMQIVSETGRIEELTTEQLKNSRQATFGGISQLGEFSPDITIDVALGLRLLGHREWLSQDDLKSMQQLSSANPDFFVLRSTDGDGHVHELRFEKDLLYALVSYRCTGPTGAYVEIANSEFERIANAYIPARIVRTSNIPDLHGSFWHPLTCQITIKTAVIDDPHNAAERFKMAWPAGLRLFDARTNDQIEVGPTTRPLTDDDIRAQLAEKQSRQQMLEDLTRRRIARILGNEPETRP